MAMVMGFNFLVTISHMRPLFTFACVVLTGLTTRAGAENWPQWRGPTRDGISREENLPTRWSTDENIRWKAPLEGLGTSTPVVWDDLVFLTSQVGVGPLDRRGAEFPESVAARDYAGATGVTFVVHAIHRDDGRTMWQHRFSAVEPKNDLPSVHPKHNLASPSVVTEGERVYAWMGLLNNYGVINNALMWMGLIKQPLQLMYTDLAIYIGLVYSYLPFMILPLYATLERMDLDLLDAAQDLGASRTQAFWDITWPLARAGVIAGCLLVFIPAMGEYVIPYLLGGPESLLIGRVLFDEFFVNRDWPMASSVAIVLLLLLVVPIVFLQRSQAKNAEGAT